MITQFNTKILKKLTLFTFVSPLFISCAQSLSAADIKKNNDEGIFSSQAEFETYILKHTYPIVDVHSHICASRIDPSTLNLKNANPWFNIYNSFSTPFDVKNSPTGLNSVFYKHKINLEYTTLTNYQPPSLADLQNRYGIDSNSAIYFIQTFNNLNLNQYSDYQLEKGIDTAGIRAFNAVFSKDDFQEYKLPILLTGFKIISNVRTPYNYNNSSCDD